MQDLPQQLINGLTLGSIFALVAIGYSMVYGIIGLINFAHGEIYMLGAYSGIVALVSLQALGVSALALLLPLALLLTVAINSFSGLAVEKLAYKPLRHRPRLVPLISAIGMSIFLQNYVALGQGNKNIALAPLFSQVWEFGSFRVSALQLVIFATTILAMALLNYFIYRTKTGKACRACAEDLNMAQLLGIDGNKIIALTFTIGAALAAVAGFLVALYYGSINPYMGFAAGMEAFTAAVLGGIGSITGALLGGLLLGLCKTFAEAYISGDYKDIITYALLILILLLRPNGILGKATVEKV